MIYPLPQLFHKMFMTVYCICKLFMLGDTYLLVFAFKMTFRKKQNKTETSRFKALPANSILCFQSPGRKQEEM